MYSSTMVEKVMGERKQMARKPHFFKVLQGDFPRRLRLPPKFVQQLLQAASNRVMLHDPNGKTWSIELENTASGTFFSNGWAEFVNDHSLNEYEFLVFQYDGNMHFNVLMFDITGCEKEDNKINQEANCYKEESDQGGPAKWSSGGSCFHQPKRSKIKEESRELEDICYSTPKEVKRTKGSISRTPVVQKKLKANKAPSYSFSSTFPCFHSRMTASSVKNPKMLKIPISFSRAHLPTHKTFVALQDPSGKVWKVVYIFSKQRYLSGGWSAFLRGNNLKEGDICIFELVGPLEFRISVLKMSQGNEC